MFICLRPRTPYLPYTLYTCIHMTQYTYSVYTQGRGGELHQREEERGNSSQSWVENTNMNDCISSLQYKL
jgi:hypothetical protein